jgi:hypothetical protein
MGKGSKAPAAPDPAETAAAQTASNKETAYWNAVLNNVNQITPYGNLTYTQTGGGKTYDDAGYQAALSSYNQQLNDYNSYVPDPDGSSPVRPQFNQSAPSRGDYLISDAPPQFTSEINLSPEQQALYDTQTRSQQGLATLGEGQIGRITDSVSTPYSYSGIGNQFSIEDAATQQANAEAAYMARLNPQFSQDEEAMRTRLINQGIGQGSQAYQREMDSFNQMKNDARSQAVLAGQQYGSNAQQQALQRRNQGISEYDAQRNAPLNEYIGLTSGVQVQNPQFSSQGYQGAQGTDVAGLINQNYQNQMSQYNAQQSGSNNLMSSLFSLGGSVAGGFAGSEAGSAAIAGLFSDERLKDNIELVGKEKGHNIYEFNYRDGSGRFRGVMAQDVIKTNPDAVMTMPNGYMAVNYDKLGLKMERVNG